MDEMMEGEAPEQDPRQAAIQALMKFLRQSEAKAVPQPEAPPMDPAAPPAEGGEGGEMTPEMLEALKSLMG